MLGGKEKKEAEIAKISKVANVCTIYTNDDIKMLNAQESSTEIGRAHV